MKVTIAENKGQASNYVENNLHSIGADDYLSALSSVEVTALKSVLPSVNYNRMLNVRQLDTTNQWELNLPYSQYDLAGNAEITRGSYDTRQALTTTLQPSTLKVYEISADMKKSITDINNMSRLGLTFYEDELKMGFQGILQKVQNLVEKGHATEKGLFNCDATALGAAYTNKVKNLQDYDIATIDGIRTLMEQLKQWMDKVYVESKQTVKVDTMVVPLKYSSTVFNTLLNVDTHPTVITIEKLIREQLGVDVVYANFSDDVNRILFYGRQCVEMFDVMRLRAFTNMVTDVKGPVEYVTYLQGSYIHVPIVTRVTPMVFRQPKGIHVVDMNAATVH